jgi:hypothetical protein
LRSDVARIEMKNRLSRREPNFSAGFEFHFLVFIF